MFNIVWWLAAKKTEEKIESLKKFNFVLFCYFILFEKLRFSFIYLFIIFLLLSWQINGGHVIFYLPHMQIFNEDDAKGIIENWIKTQGLNWKILKFRDQIENTPKYRDQKCISAKKKKVLNKLITNLVSDYD